MVIRRSHWIKAGIVALAVHAAVLVGLRSDPPGEASPPPGPKIEMATSMPDVIGSTDASLESTSAETIEEVSDPVKEAVLKPETATDTTAVLDADEPDLQDPELTEVKPETDQPEPIVTEPELQRPEPSLQKQKTAQKIKKKLKRKKAKARKKKKNEKVKRKKKSKPSRASKRGSKRKGKAGTKRSGGGKSRASAGAINRYASRVRARILSRRPGSGGRQGTTVVSFRISKSGGLSGASISRSSGSSALDQKALSAVRRSSPFPRPPGGARGGQLRFSIRFNFR